MELYHIHKTNDYDDLYQVGKTLNVGGEPNNFRLQSLNSSPCILTKSEKDEDGTIRDYYNPLIDFLDEDKIRNSSPEEQVELLNEIKNYYYESQLNIREMILEEVRRDQHPELPSRYECIWLCNKQDLNKWIEMLNASNTEFSVYKVKTARKPFCTLARLLPGHYKTNLMYMAALRYWNPTKEDLRKRGKEYLYTGELEIVERVK